MPKIRVNTTIDEDLVLEIDKRRNKKNRSQFIEDAIKYYIENKKSYLERLERIEKQLNNMITISQFNMLKDQVSVLDNIISRKRHYIVEELFDSWERNKVNYFKIKNLQDFKDKYPDEFDKKDLLVILMYLEEWWLTYDKENDKITWEKGFVDRQRE